MRQDLRTVNIEGNKTDPITIKRYRLVLSVWLDHGEDTVEMRDRRRGMEYCVAPNLFGAPVPDEKEVIKELCRGIMELEGINE